MRAAANVFRAIDRRVMTIDAPRKTSPPTARPSCLSLRGDVRLPEVEASGGLDRGALGLGIGEDEDIVVGVYNTSRDRSSSGACCPSL